MKPYNSSTFIVGLCLTFFMGSALASNTASSSNSHGASKSNNQANTPQKKHGKAHWAYTGSEGPSHWGTLVKEYSICSSGRNQSPINIDGTTQDSLFELWNQMPASAGPATTYNNITVNANELLPRSKAYYHYRGSLTTPPCSEGVRWFVMRGYAEVSRDQVQKFNSIVGNNNRPIQHRNNRFLLRN